MKRIVKPTFSFVFVDTEESSSRLQVAYVRIFSLAKKRLIDKQSTQKYSKSHEPEQQSARVSHDRGSSGEVKSNQGDTLSNGSQGQDTSGEVRQVMANKQGAFDGVTQGKGS